MAFILLLVWVTIVLAGNAEWRTYYGYYYDNRTSNEYFRDTGWFMYGVPYILNDTLGNEYSIRDFLCNSSRVDPSLGDTWGYGSCDEAYFYNITDKEWYHWRLDTPDSQNTITSIGPGQGLWVNTTSKGYVNNIYGDMPVQQFSDNPIWENLKPGWNLMYCRAYGVCGTAINDQMKYFIPQIQTKWNITIVRIWGVDNHSNDLIHQLYPEEGNYGFRTAGYWFCVNDTADPDYCLREDPPLMPWQNQRPELTNMRVIGDQENDTLTNFRFQVTYKDSDNDAPAEYSVFLDGVEYQMTASGTDYRNGVTFTFDKNFTYGKHDYYFLFDDGRDHTSPRRVPYVGAYSFEVIGYPGPELIFLSEKSYGSVTRASLKSVNYLTGITMWEYWFPNERYITGSPVVFQDTVYIGTPSGRLHAIYAKNGTLKWIYTVPNEMHGNIQGTPLVRSDGIYFQTYAGMYALNLYGLLKWVRSDLKGDKDLVSNTDRIFVATDIGYRKRGLFAIDVTDGSTIWAKYDKITLTDREGTTYDSYRGFHTPVIYGGNIYTIRYGNLTSYTADGTLRWQNGSNGSAFTRVTVLNDVYATGWEYGFGPSIRLYSFDSDGRPKWKSEPFTETRVALNGRAYPVQPSAPTISGTNAYVTVGNALYSLKTSDGSLNWKKTFTSGLGPVAVSSGFVMIKDSSGTLFVLDTSGNTLWTALINGGMPVVCDGSCYGSTITATSTAVPEPAPANIIPSQLTASSVKIIEPVEISIKFESVRIISSAEEGQAPSASVREIKEPSKTVQSSSGLREIK
jgi:outer membrane protein assembly factor BamB